MQINNMIVSILMILSYIILLIYSKFDPFFIFFYPIGIVIILNFGRIEKLKSKIVSINLSKRFESASTLTSEMLVHVKALEGLMESYRLQSVKPKVNRENDPENVSMLDIFHVHEKEFRKSIEDLKSVIKSIGEENE